MEDLFEKDNQPQLLVFPPFPSISTTQSLVSNLWKTYNPRYNHDHCVYFFREKISSSDTHRGEVSDIMPCDGDDSEESVNKIQSRGVDLTHRLNKRKITTHCVCVLFTCSTFTCRGTQ